MNPSTENAASFSIDEIASVTGGTVLRNGPPVRGIAAYPQDVVPGNAYVAVGASAYDYTRRVAEAALAGAAAFVIERAMSCPPGCGAVLVRSATEALATLARAHRTRWGSSAGAAGDERVVISITGTSGKSSTRRLVAELLRLLHRGGVLETGDALDHIGVSLNLLSLTEAHRFAVVETATRERGDVARLAELAVPDVAALTLVGFAHAEGVGSIDDVALEKGDLLAAVRPGGIVAYNADDRYAAAQAVRASARRRVTWGFSPSADYRLLSRAPLGLNGSRLRVGRPGSAELTIVTRSFGVGGALAIGAAIAIVETTTGEVLDAELIDDAVRRADDGRGARLSSVTLPDETIVLSDASDATPASMRSCLEAAGEVASALARRLVIIFGELHELGRDAAREHAALGADIALRRPAVLVTIGANARNTAVEALSLGVTAFAANDEARATPRVLSTVYAGDVVLIAGGRGNGLESLARALVARALGPRRTRHERLAKALTVSRGAGRDGTLVVQSRRASRRR